MIQSHFVSLERPYPIICYGSEVAMQVGTLIVVDEARDENGNYGITTHSHPVVSYANRKHVKFSALKPRYIADGVVWDRVELASVGTIGTEEGGTISWWAFERMIDIGLYNSVTDAPFTDVSFASRLYKRFEDLGMEVILPPTDGEYYVTLSKTDESNDKTIVCHSVGVDVRGFGDHDIDALSVNFPMWAKGADEKSLYEELKSELEAYMKIVGDDVYIHFSSVDKELKKVAEALNKWLGTE